MERIESGLLIGILKKHRERLNQQFLVASQQNPSLDDGIFFTYLNTILEPIVELNRHQPIERLEAFTLKLYRQILSLYSRHFLASEGRYPFFEHVFLELVEHVQSLVFDHPQIISDVGNAALKLSEALGEDVKAWSSLVLKTAVTSYDKFLKRGYVAAWICGYAPYREQAIVYLEDIDNDSFKVLFEIDSHELNDESKEQVIAELRVNRWFHPRHFLSDVKPAPLVFNTIGGFAGFDFPFLLPPRVYEKDGQIMVTDSRHTYQLFADCFGQQLIEIDHIENTSQAPVNAFNPIVFRKGTVLFQGEAVSQMPRMSIPIRSKVCCNQTCCYTSHSSYKVYIFGLSAGN